MNRRYSDHEHQKIAAEEYSVYKARDILTIKNDNGEYEPIGTVREVIEDDTGLKVYVVESLDKKKVISHLYSVTSVLKQTHMK